MSELPFRIPDIPYGGVTNVAVGIAVETDVAASVIPVQIVVLGIALEADEVFSITVVGGAPPLIVPPIPSGAALARPVNTYDIGLTREYDEAFAIMPHKFMTADDEEELAALLALELVS